MRTPTDALRSLQLHFGAGLRVIDPPGAGETAWRVEVAKTDGRFSRPQVTVAFTDAASFPARPAGRVDYRRPVTVQAFCREQSTPHRAMLEGTRVEHLLEQLLLDQVRDGFPNRIALHDFTDGRAAAIATGAAVNDTHIVWTAAVHGVAGQGTVIDLAAPAGPDTDLEITVDEKTVTVTLAGDSSGDPASTAEDVVAAVADDPAAAAVLSGQTDAQGICVPQTEPLAGGGAIGVDEAAQPGARADHDFLRVDDVTIGPPIVDPQDRRLVMVPATFFVMWCRSALLLKGPPTQATVSLRSDLE